MSDNIFELAADAVLLAHSNVDHETSPSTWVQSVSLAYNPAFQALVDVEAERAVRVIIDAGLSEKERNTVLDVLTPLIAGISAGCQSMVTGAVLLSTVLLDEVSRSTGGEPAHIIREFLTTVNYG